MMVAQVPGARVKLQTLFPKGFELLYLAQGTSALPPDQCGEIPHLMSLWPRPTAPFEVDSAHELG